MEESRREKERSIRSKKRVVVEEPPLFVFVSVCVRERKRERGRVGGDAGRGRDGARQELTWEQTKTSLRTE